MCAQIRKQWHELNIRPNDADDRIYVLVTGVDNPITKQPEPDLFVVRGWYYGKTAKQHSEWLQCHGGRPAAWFVPQDRLHPIDLLLRDDDAIALQRWHNVRARSETRPCFGPGVPINGLPKDANLALSAVVAAQT